MGRCYIFTKINATLEATKSTIDNGKSIGKKARLEKNHTKLGRN